MPQQRIVGGIGLSLSVEPQVFHRSTCLAKLRTTWRSRRKQASGSISS